MEPPSYEPVPLRSWRKDLPTSLPPKPSPKPPPKPPPKSAQRPQSARLSTASSFGRPVLGRRLSNLEVMMAQLQQDQDRSRHELQMRRESQRKELKQLDERGRRSAYEGLSAGAIAAERTDEELADALARERRRAHAKEGMPFENMPLEPRWRTSPKDGRGIAEPSPTMSTAESVRQGRAETEQRRRALYRELRDPRRPCGFAAIAA